MACEIPEVIRQLCDSGAIFYVSHSGGKDSQAMYLRLRKVIPSEQIVVVHADLGEVEWPGIVGHINDTISHTLNIVRAGKTFLGMVEKRGMWPSARYRQCTSDLKRGPIEKFIRADMRGRGGGMAVNCIGLRAEESTARAARQPFRERPDLTTKNRKVWDWLPVFSLTTQQVFATISAAAQQPFWAYEVNERISCVFCFMASRNDLRNGAMNNPVLYRRYVEMERRIGHTLFTQAKRPVSLEAYIGIPISDISSLDWADHNNVQMC